MKKLLIGTSLLLATLAATPSFAATRHMRAPEQPSYTTGSDAYAAAPGYAYGGSPAVIVGGQVIGADPDPNVRLQLLRDADLPNAD